jgi:ring-1,2-phenylacetyl-CoA epoxidase subunit PaaE
MLNFFKKKAVKEDLTREENTKPSAGFHPLKVADVRRETADCVSVAFEIPASLKEEFHFVQGQYLTFKKEIKGEEVRRSYSICSSPLDGELRVAIKEVPDGRFSTFANRQLQVGDVLESMTPRGNFHRPLDPNNASEYVAFASGSGITPVMSILKTTMQREPKSRFMLFYGNRSTSSVIFRDQLDDLKNEFMGRLEVHHVLSREDQGTDLLKGRLDAEKCKNFAERFFDPATVSAYYLCGPGEMIGSISETLEALGAPKDRILYELFSTPGSAKIEGKTNKSEKRDFVADVTVILDSDETHFSIGADGKSILDAALDAGADVPFACKGAVCCTCRAKVLEGEVEMDMNYALEDDEVEEGYVLTCQSHPRSQKVVISYDE